MREGWVYILTNKPFGTLYIGVTSDMARRIEEHRTTEAASFTQRYNLHRLVFVEHHATIAQAIQRETSLKRWLRAWKIELIAAGNPNWKDLSGQW